MEPIKVIFVDMPKLVRQILSEAVSADSRLVIEEHVANADDAADVLAHFDGGVVLVGDTRLDEHTIEELLRRAPEIAFLGVHASGDGLEVHELVPHRISRTESAPHEVCNVISEVGERRWRRG